MVATGDTMPFPSPNFVACFPLQEYFVDKDTGEPLSAGVVTFYEDNDRTVLKPIYQQVQAPDNTYSFVQLNNPLTLTIVGTFGDDNGNDIIPYLYPYAGLPTDAERGALDLYYITVYAAVPPIGTAALQFTREAWPPNIEDSGSTTTDTAISTNEIANPQFVEVNFNATTGLTTNVSGTGTVTNIAPDWDVITNGTGSFTVNQIAVVDTAAISDPPYALQITSSSIDSPLILRQRITNSPRLLANANVASYFVASSQDSIQHTLTMNYVPSTGTSYQLATGFATSDAAYTPIFGVVPTTGTINTDPATTGYVEIQIVIPVGAVINLTSFQMLGVPNLQTEPSFLQLSTPRQIDNLYHYAYPIVPIGGLIDFAGFVLPAHYFLCNGDAISRLTYRQLFAAITTVETVSLTNTVNTFTVVSGLVYHIGMAVEGTGIPSSTTITGISTNTITISNAASATVSSAVTFFAWGDGDGSTTFNVPDLRDYVTAGANGSLFGVANNAVGATGGSATHTIIANELPAHTHGLSGITGLQNNAGGTPGSSDIGTGTGTANTLTNTTSGTAMSIVQQTAFVKKCIRYE